MRCFGHHTRGAPECQGSGVCGLAWHCAQHADREGRTRGCVVIMNEKVEVEGQDFSCFGRFGQVGVVLLGDGLVGDCYTAGCKLSQLCVKTDHRKVDGCVVIMNEKESSEEEILPGSHESRVDPSSRQRGVPGGRR